MIKICAVKSCRSTSVRNPKRNFFPIPKNNFLREEWLSVLALTEVEHATVCELHFRVRDFGRNRRHLKSHAVPVVKSSSNAENSEEEFRPGEDESSSDPEIVEVKNISKSPVKIKEEPKEETKVKEEQPSPMEPEVGRRPSRRAAQLAVQKIHNTVRQFGLHEGALEQIVESPIRVEPKLKRPSNSPKVVPKRIREVTKEWHAIRAPVPDIDLIMVCHEELLSAVQAETILKAQREYNAVMKRLRILKASNVKITCLNNDDEMPPSPVPILPAGTPKSPNLVTLASANVSSNSPNIITVVPVHLVSVPPQAGQHILKPPGSPAVFKKLTAD